MYSSNISVAASQHPFFSNIQPMQEEVKYVEVPVVQEVVRQVPKKEIVEVEKKIPVYEYQYVDKIVEVPQIHYVDKIVEVPQVQEVIKRVPVTEIIEVPKEIIRHVPKIETKVVEKIVEVPGEVIEVPKVYQVENKIVVPSYVKKEVPTVVSQKLIPTIHESETDVMEVTVNEYVPKMVPIDVYVPKPINRQLMTEKTTEKHEIVKVPPAQWNSLVLNANSHIANEADLKDLLIANGDGIPTISGSGTQIVTPQGDISEIMNRNEADKFKLHVSHDNAPTRILHQAPQQIRTDASTPVQRIVQNQHSYSIPVASTPQSYNQTFPQTPTAVTCAPQERNQIMYVQSPMTASSMPRVSNFEHQFAPSEYLSNQMYQSHGNYLTQRQVQQPTFHSAQPSVINYQDQMRSRCMQQSYQMM